MLYIPSLGTSFISCQSALEFTSINAFSIDLYMHVIDCNIHLWCCKLNFTFIYLTAQNLCWTGDARRPGFSFEVCPITLLACSDCVHLISLVYISWSILIVYTLFSLFCCTHGPSIMKYVDFLLM